MPDDTLYTPEDLAKKLKLSKYTIYEMIKRGDIEAHRFGRSLRISQAQLDSYFMQTSRAENIYDALIMKEGLVTYAVHNNVKICVSTSLEGKVKVFIRPEDIILATGAFKSSARNVFPGRVSDIMYDDRSAKILLDIGLPMIVHITRQSMIDLDVKIGDTFYAVFKALSVEVAK